MNKKNEEIKVDKPDFTNLPLTEYYNGLPTATRVITRAPKDELLAEIARLTGRTPETVRTWCLGTKRPARHVQEKIAKHFKTKPEILFPEAV